jgi:hypothetical protein
MSAGVAVSTEEVKTEAIIFLELQVEILIVRDSNKMYGGIIAIMTTDTTLAPQKVVTACRNKQKKNRQ